eukprot:2720100-Pleurochrysis_carterae.AAC.2
MWLRVRSKPSNRCMCCNVQSCVRPAKTSKSAWQIVLSCRSEAGFERKAPRESMRLSLRLGLLGWEGELEGWTAGCFRVS